MRTVVLYARSPDWRAVVERADELMASPDFRVLKSEARTRAGFVEVPGAGAAFIKRVEVPSWSRGVFERIRGSRAARSLAGAAMLKAHGLAHPEPLAAMDVYQAGAIRASYLVSRALINADSLSRFMLGPGEIKGRDVHRRKQISDTVAAQIRRLHESGLYTRDLQETNIMVEDNEHGGFNVYFIDLEDFRRTANVSWKRRITEPGASRSQHRAISLSRGASRFSLFLPGASARSRGCAQDRCRSQRGARGDRSPQASRRRQLPNASWPRSLEELR